MLCPGKQIFGILQITCFISVVVVEYREDRSFIPCDLLKVLLDKIRGFISHIFQLLLKYFSK